MELIPLTADQWGDGGNALKLLWLSLPFVLIASGSFITAHAIIPSAIATGTLPQRLSKLRPVFYALGFIAVAAVAINVVLIIDFLDYIEVVFGRRYR
ncbi:MAG: hypothetical protein IIB28_01505 [Chloroflexi bacterium]|nr:hypothetical protein [Chloroflexota bacterium]